MSIKHPSTQPIVFGKPGKMNKNLLKMSKYLHVHAQTTFLFTCWLSDQLGKLSN